MGGTKEEMQRLLEDAQKLTGVKYDITNLNDVFQAIHVIQGELGITGTTAKEAEETISGSIASMKSAWDNFLNGSGTFDEFVSSAKIAFNNIATAVAELLPRMAGEIANALPKEFVTAVKIITPVLITLGTALGVIWGYFKMVAIIKAVSTAFATLNAIMMANPILLIVSLIAGLVAGFLYLWNTSEGFRNFWIGLWEGIKNAVKTAIDFVIGIFNTVVNFVENIKQFFIDAWNNIVAFFTKGIPNFINSIIQWFQELPMKIAFHIGEMLGSIIKFGIDVGNWVTTELPLIIENIINWFAELPGRIWEWLCNVVNSIIAWGQDMWNSSIAAISNMINGIINWFAELPRKYMDMVVQCC